MDAANRRTSFHWPPDEFLIQHTANQTWPAASPRPWPPWAKPGKSRRLLVRTDAAGMLKRRLKQAGLPAHYSPHSFRATGITNFLENDGTLEAAQRIARQADSRTTKLYDRRGQKVLLEDMERIRY